jgi:DNA-binding transcriptional MerR regulator
MYTVKQLANSAGVSARTLRYYDQIGLLKPTTYGKNGYRYYDDVAALRLQQILFYRELELSLKEIRAIIEQPDFNLLDALESHKVTLQQKKQRIKLLLSTIEKTIRHIEGKISMNKKDIFAGFSAEEQKVYADEARQRWDPVLVDQSQRRWSSYSGEKKKEIMAEANEIYATIFANSDKGHNSHKIQDLIGQWHQHLRYFYEPSIPMLRGLGQLYCDDPRFRVKFEKFNPQFPEFLRDSIAFYCDQVEK